MGTRIKLTHEFIMDNRTATEGEIIVTVSTEFVYFYDENKRLLFKVSRDDFRDLVRWTQNDIGAGYVE